MKIRSALILFALALPVVAACSDDSTTTAGGDTTTLPAPSTTAGGSSTPSTASASAAGGGLAAASSTLGTILVDADGMTVYAFMPDTATTSACEGGCAGTWPPVTDAGTPGDGVDASKLGTLMRSDGSAQVTYNGHPLYTFSGDQAAGDTNGQGVGGKWFVIGTDGNPIQ